MLIVRREETDPYYNIAAEEYCLKNIPGDIFMTWVNEPCIVIGKHQNALAEINYRFARDNGIPVIRRITGGGTVFQDEGNLNFSFIVNGEKEKLVDYRKFTQPVIDFLHSLGIRAEFEARSNITLHGRKISGNSAHVYRNRVIHHGTLLINSNLEILQQALKPGPALYLDKGVRSVRKEVTNLSDHMARKLPVAEFSNGLIEFIMNNNPGNSLYTFTGDDRMLTGRLAVEKYRSWDWNFGWSPDYIMENEIEDGNLKWHLLMSVSKGIIKAFKMDGPSSAKRHELEPVLTGLAHREDVIREALDNVNFAGYFKAITRQTFIDHLF